MVFLKKKFLEVFLFIFLLIICLFTSFFLFFSLNNMVINKSGYKYYNKNFIIELLIILVESIIINYKKILVKISLF